MKKKKGLQMLHDPVTPSLVVVVPKETKDEEKELDNVLSWVGKGK